MKVLLVNQFFWPYEDAVAALAADLAEDLVAAGHEVTVLASRAAGPDGRRPPRRETWRGVQIVRARGTAFGKASLAGRIADYLTYLVGALAFALTAPRPSVVVATTAPPLVVSIGLALRALRGVRLVYWLQDLYPELAVAFGILRPRSSSTWLFERLSRAALRRADAVLVPGAPMAERVRAKGVPAERVHVVPNWADGARIAPVAPGANAFRRALGLEGRRIVLYSGNMGRGHDLATALALAERCRDRNDLAFVFIGGGARREEVAAVAARLPSVKLLPFVAREVLSESLSAADVHLVTQDPSTAGLLEPSKLYAIMAAGRPVLYLGPADTEVARTILAEGIGARAANGDVEGALAALDALLDGGPTVSHVRGAFEARHDRHVRTSHIARLVGGPHPC